MAAISERPTRWQIMRVSFVRLPDYRTGVCSTARRAPVRTGPHPWTCPHNPGTGVAVDGWPLRWGTFRATARPCERATGDPQHGEVPNVLPRRRTRRPICMRPDRPGEVGRSGGGRLGGSSRRRGRLRMRRSLPCIGASSRADRGTARRPRGLAGRPGGDERGAGMRMGKRREFPFMRRENRPNPLTSPMLAESRALRNPTHSGAFTDLQKRSNGHKTVSQKAGLGQRGGAGASAIGRQTTATSARPLAVPPRDDRWSSSESSTPPA